MYPEGKPEGVQVIVAKFHGGDSFETTMTNTEGGVTKVTQIKGPKDRRL